MKRIIVAFMFVVSTSLAYASSSTNLNYEDYGTCTVTVTFYDSDGNVTGSQTYTSWQPDELSCQVWAAQIGRLFRPMQ